MKYGDKGFVILNEQLIEAVIVRAGINLTVVLLQDVQNIPFHKGDIINIPKMSWRSSK